MVQFQTCRLATLALRPDRPLLCRSYATAEATAKTSVAAFPGRILYAVKCDPDAGLLHAVARGGVRHFDAASLSEVRLVHDTLPDAEIAFMHPVKAPAAIAESYFDHGVRTFAVDCEEELDKILDATGDARDVNLLVRLAVPEAAAGLPMHGKFGIAPDKAPGLLQRARAVSERVGVHFHVGSQAYAPDAFRAAMDLADSVAMRAGVLLDIVDVGGGFPAPYPGDAVPDFSVFADTIARRFQAMRVASSCELWAEPGRALAAEAASLVVQVMLRRENTLFINDGAFGALHDAARFGQRHPVELLRDGAHSDHVQPFKVFGPTCDAADAFPEAWLLPADTRAGDFIEVGMAGAYAKALASSFNGFGELIETEVETLNHSTAGVHAHVRPPHSALSDKHGRT